MDYFVGVVLFKAFDTLAKENWSFFAASVLKNFADITAMLETVL